MMCVCACVRGVRAQFRIPPSPLVSFSEIINFHKILSTILAVHIYLKLARIPGIFREIKHSARNMIGVRTFRLTQRVGTLVHFETLWNRSPLDSNQELYQMTGESSAS